MNRIIARRLIFGVLLVVLLLPNVIVVIDGDGVPVYREFRQERLSKILFVLSSLTLIPSTAAYLSKIKLGTAGYSAFAPFPEPTSQLWLRRFLMAQYKGHTNFV